MLLNSEGKEQLFNLVSLKAPSRVFCFITQNITV